jgi:DNA replication protein DnaC
MQNHAKYLRRTLESMPEWPVKAARDERRKVIHPKLLAAIDAWDGKSSLVVLGPTGAGKTTGMVELVITLATRQAWPLCPVPLFAKARDLTQAWRGSKLGAEVDPECVDAAKSARLLLLDDLGQEPNDPQRVLWAIADARYDRRTPTIVTSGLRVDGLTTRYEDAFLRRFEEACGKDSGRVVDLWGQP